MKKKADTKVSNQMGIPIKEMLFPKGKRFKAPRPRLKRIKKPNSSETRVLASREDAKNHPIRKKFNVSTEEVQKALQSVYDALSLRVAQRHLGKNAAEKAQDEAVTEFFCKNRSTPERFAILAIKLAKIQKGGLELSPLNVILNKLHNFKIRKEPGKIQIENFDKWLCKDWVNGSGLCARRYSQILELWNKEALKRGYSVHFDASHIKSRVNRLKLKKLKIESST